MSKQLKRRDDDLRKEMVDSGIATKDLLSVSTFVQKNKGKLGTLAAIIATGLVEAEDAVGAVGISLTSFYRISQAAEKVLHYLEMNGIDYKDTEFEDLIEIHNTLLNAEAMPQKKIVEAMFKKIEGKFHTEGECIVFEKGASIKDLEVLSRHINKRKRDNRSTANNTNIQVNSQNNIEMTQPTKIEIIDPNYIRQNMYEAQRELIAQTNAEVDLIEQQIENGDFDDDN